MKRVFFVAAAIIGLLLLAQHAHFTIDVVAAPVASYGAVRLQRRLARRSGMLVPGKGRRPQELA